jgi:uncharacterized HAD superfamily protein
MIFSANMIIPFLFFYHLFYDIFLKKSIVLWNKIQLHDIILKNMLGVLLMKIGFDIDDVITDTSSSMKNYVMKYDKNGELKANMEDIMRGDASTPFIEQFFVDHFLSIAKSAKVKPHAYEVIQNLLAHGHEIYLITARGEEQKIFHDAEALTLAYLKEHSIGYTDLIFNCVDKAKVCKDYKIDVMVDDSIKHCEAVRNAGIRSILFTSCVNETLPTTVTRVKDWWELEKELK